MRISRNILYSFLFLVFIISSAQAASPNRIVYQGRLTKSGVSLAGSHTFVARILSKSGTALWSSGNMTVTLPATGEFTLVLEPTGVDWANQEPRLEITVDGDTLTPAEPFSTNPYAFFADKIGDSSVTNSKVASGAAIEASKILISGSVSLANWRSAENPEKIDANVIQGTVPVSSNQIAGTALVAFATFTQIMEPTENVVPLTIKPNTGSSASLDILKLQSQAGADVVVFHSTGDVDISGRLRDKTGFLLPVGTIVAYGGSSPPAGWLLCDGSAVSRSTHADLFSVISTSFGSGDGSTTFNLPDLRGRAAIGAGQGSGLMNRTLGVQVGAETHTLTSAEIPAHSHGVNDPGHSHSGRRDTSGVNDNYISARGDAYNFTAAIEPNTTGITIQNNTGGGGAHNNMQPSLVVNYIIKY